jgi:hypothetical protein
MVNRPGFVVDDCECMSGVSASWAWHSSLAGNSPLFKRRDEGRKAGRPRRWAADQVSDRQRRERFLRVDAKLADGAGHRGLAHLAAATEGIEHGDHHRLGVDFEKPAQVLA